MGAGFLAVIWASTLGLQVPLHRRLQEGYSRRLIRQLVRTNWLRTVAWTAYLMWLAYCMQTQHRFGV